MKLDNWIRRRNCENHLLEWSTMRRTKAEIDSIKAAIYDLCEKYAPMTVRQLFYQLTTIGAIDKTEQEYKGTVCRLTKEMRLNAELPWDWLADNTRWMHKPRTYGGISDVLEASQEAYRRTLWDPKTNPHYCEVWIEKDALTGVFYDVTSEYDVPLMPCKGYPSLSFLRNAAFNISINNIDIIIKMDIDSDLPQRFMWECLLLIDCG